MKCYAAEIKLAYEDVIWLCNCLCGYFSTKMIYKAVVRAERVYTWVDHLISNVGIEELICLG